MCGNHYVRFLEGTQRAVHAVGPGKIAYEVTLGAPQSPHRVDADSLEKVVELVGATAEDPLRWCICVDRNSYDAWAEQEHVVVPSHLAGLVRVYVVLIKRPPLPSPVRRQGLLRAN